ncbi:MAG: helix-turn-helix domain-containing protein [Candidatus Brocadiae bacterium]|nr:helix-turn-helix domain-containing protein [Candidatus Brocadiia bacterium]
MSERLATDVITLREAATFVRVSEKTMRELARANKVPGQKVGREWRFLRSALEAWLAHREPAGIVAEPDVQYELPFTAKDAKPVTPGKLATGFGDTAFTKNRNQPLHRWVPWIAGFSSSFVGSVLEAASEKEPRDVTVLDPFAGVGTTLVEAVERGHSAIGFEINPYAALVSRVKVQCPRYNLAKLKKLVHDFKQFMDSRTRAAPKSSPPAQFKSRVPFFSPKVERLVLHVLDFAGEQHEGWLRDVLRVALGSVLVSFSNYSYEPSLGTRSAAGKDDVLEADVASIVAAKLGEIACDVAQLQLRFASREQPPRAELFHESFLDGYANVPPRSVDFLITSPPYLNNYHYIRNTRPHLFWLGLVEHRAALKDMEQTSFGKFWQTVRSGPEVPLDLACDGLPEQLDELRGRNTEKGVYGGGGWANYAVTYFNDCLRFCRAAHEIMAPGGAVVVVIGNNILQGIEFKTDEYFAQIAEQCGFERVEMHRVRKKRTGTSIIRSSVRMGDAKKRVELYETAVELRA